MYFISSCFVINLGGINSILLSYTAMYNLSDFASIKLIPLPKHLYFRSLIMKNLTWLKTIANVFKTLTETLTPVNEPGPIVI